MLILCLHHYSSNMYYDSFMLTPDSVEELNEDYDDISCMTRDTGTVRTSFRYAVDESKSESNTKRSSAASGHIQDYMDAICHEPSRCEDLQHFHITHVFWGRFGTYLSQHAKKIRIWGGFLGARTKPQKQVMRVGKRLVMILFCCYIHQKIKMIKVYLIS